MTEIISPLKVDRRTTLMSALAAAIAPRKAVGTIAASIKAAPEATEILSAAQDRIVETMLKLLRVEQMVASAI